MKHYAVITERTQLLGFRSRVFAERHSKLLPGSRVEEYELSAIDALIYELQDMIDGGEECAGRDTHITYLIELAKRAKEDAKCKA